MESVAGHVDNTTVRPFCDGGRSTESVQDTVVFPVVRPVVDPVIIEAIWSSTFKRAGEQVVHRLVLECYVVSTTER